MTAKGKTLAPVAVAFIITILLALAGGSADVNTADRDGVNGGVYA